MLPKSLEGNFKLEVNKTKNQKNPTPNRLLYLAMYNWNLKGHLTLMVTLIPCGIRNQSIIQPGATMKSTWLLQRLHICFEL